MRAVITGLAFLLMAPEVVADDFLITYHRINYERAGETFWDKTVREISSEEASNAIGALVAVVTENPAAGAAATQAVKSMHREGNHRIESAFYRAPAGYVACRAIIHPVGGGAGILGIEAHNSTFTMKIVRNLVQTGFKTRATLPYDRGNSHIAAKFWLTFVRREQFQDNSHLCEEAGSLIWTIKNNDPNQSRRSRKAGRSWASR